MAWFSMHSRPYNTNSPLQMLGARLKVCSAACSLQQLDQSNRDMLPHAVRTSVIKSTRTP